MKHNCTCQSLAGADNLATPLAPHHIGNLRRVQCGWTAHSHPDGLCAVTAPMPAFQANREPPKGSCPPLRTLSGTDSPKDVRDILPLKPVYGPSPNRLTCCPVLWPHATGRSDNSLIPHWTTLLIARALSTSPPCK